MMTYVKNVARHEIDANVMKSTDGRLDIVDFWAPWCGPCKTMDPILEKLAQKYENRRIDIYKVNVDDESEFAKILSVRSVPTTIFFKNGKRVRTFVGTASEAELEQEILKNI